MHSNAVSLVTKCFIQNDQGEILILRRSPTARIRPGEWDLPGGLIDDGEDPNLAVAREIREETGLTIGEPAIAYIATELEPAYILTFFYSAKYDGGTIQISAEHTEFRWIDRAGFAGLDLPEKFGQAVNKLLP